MEIQNPVSSSSSAANAVSAEKKRPVLLMVAGGLLLAIVAFALYLSFAKTAIQDQQKQLDVQIGSLTAQIDQLKNQNLEGQQYAREWLSQLEKSEIRWSQVIKTVQDLIPTDSLTQKPRVAFLSYSGSPGGKLTLNAQTVPGSVDAFGDISTLLNVFNNSTYFKDGYVPSISHGLTQTGQDLLTFVFNVTYEEQLPGSQPVVQPATQQVIQPVASPAVLPAVKVPRSQ